MQRAFGIFGVPSAALSHLFMHMQATLLWPPKFTTRPEKNASYKTKDLRHELAVQLKRSVRVCRAESSTRSMYIRQARVANLPEKNQKKEKRN